MLSRRRYRRRLAMARIEFLRLLPRFGSEPRSFSEAVAKAVPRRLRGPGSDCDVVSRAVEECPQILDKLGRILALPVRHAAHLPTKRLIRSCGLPLEAMRRALVVPQRAGSVLADYCLLLADPSAVDLQEFRECGIEVALTTSSVVEHAWREYLRITDAQEAPAVTMEARSRILLRLARDCELLGANSVELGVPLPDRYSFQCGGQLYTGRIPAGLESCLSRDLESGSGLLEFPIEEFVFSISAAKDADAGSLRVKWCKTEAIEMPEPRRAGRSASGRRDGSRRKVLLVEDDEAFALILRKLLNAEGYEVLHKTNGADALHWLLSGGAEHTGLIVCDVHLPRLDGIALTGKLRQQCSTLPVLLLTSDDSESIDLEAATEGASVVLRKCSNPAVLIAWVNNLLRRSGKGRPAKAEEIEVVHAG